MVRQNQPDAGFAQIDFITGLHDMGMLQAPAPHQKRTIAGGLIQHFPLTFSGVELQLQMMGTDVGIGNDHIILVGTADLDLLAAEFVALAHPAMAGQYLDYDFHCSAPIKRCVRRRAFSRLTPATEKFTSMPLRLLARDAMATATSCSAGKRL